MFWQQIDSLKTVGSPQISKHQANPLLIVKYSLYVYVYMQGISQLKYLNHQLILLKKNWGDHETRSTKTHTVPGSGVGLMQ